MKKIIQAQLDSALSSARSIKNQYDQISLRALGRQISGDSITREERDNEQEMLDNLFRAMEQAYEEADRWRDRLESDQTSEREVQQAVGSWSAQALSAMLGPSDYEQEIAKNSKKSVELQRQIADNTKQRNTTEVYAE